MMAAAAVSCTIDPYGYDNGTNHRTGNNLIEYSEDILNRFGTALTEDLIYLLTLDEFLKLTPEEQNQIQWSEFKSKIEHYTDTYLRIPSRGIVIATRGLSLTEPGNSWTMEIIDFYSYNESGSDTRFSIGYYGEVLGHSKIRRITCTEENRYEIIDEKGKDIMSLELEAIPSPYGGYDFTGSGSGKITGNEKGLSAEYSLFELYYRKHRTDSDGTGNSSVTVTYSPESLNLRVYTYHDGEALDWCELVKTADSEIEYRSNLEYIEDRYYYE